MSSGKLIKRLKISVSTFYRLRESGLIPAPTVGTRARKKYSPEAVKQITLDVAMRKFK